MKSPLSLIVAIIAIPVKIFFKPLVGFIAKSFYQWLGYEVTTVLGNITVGAIVGGVSLLIIPQYIIPSFQIRFINLIVTPVVIGALINLSSNIKFHRKLLTFDLINFVSGYTFALALAGVRYFFAG